MSIIIKIDRQQFRLLLDVIKNETSNVYMTCKYDNVEILFLYDVNKTSICTINIDHESYVHDLKKNSDPVSIAFNPRLLLLEINEISKNTKNKFLSLSINPGSDLMKIKSTE